MESAIHRSSIKDSPEKGTWQDKVKEYSLWMMNHNVSHEEVSTWLKKFLGMVAYMASWMSMSEHRPESL